MIDGFRITILTGIFRNLGACFSWIVLVFYTFSCCWSSREKQLLRSLCYCRDQAPSRPSCRLCRWSLAWRDFQSNTHFSTQRWVVCGKVIGKNHRRSPLVQGGLEIPLQGTAEMDPKGTRQYSKTINRLSFQIIKKSRDRGSFRWLYKTGAERTWRRR